MCIIILVIIDFVVGHSYLFSGIWLQVGISVPFIYGQVSPAICMSVLELIHHLNTLHLQSDDTIPSDHDLINVQSYQFQTPVSCFSITLDLGSFDVDLDLANKEGNGSLLKLAFKQLDIRYVILLISPSFTAAVLSYEVYNFLGV